MLPFWNISDVTRSLSRADRDNEKRWKALQIYFGIHVIREFLLL